MTESERAKQEQTNRRFSYLMQATEIARASGDVSQENILKIAASLANFVEAPGGDQ